MTDHLKLTIIIEIFTNSVTKKSNILLCETMNWSFSSLSGGDLFSCHQVAFKNEYKSCFARPLFIITY